jgi:hypothetical protein
MSGTIVGLTNPSRNKKTGKIPVSTSRASTCPKTCPLIKNGCYANTGPIAINWRRIGVDRGMSWVDFCTEVSKFPDGQVWRHNQAGDLPGVNGRINKKELHDLVNANRGKRGFTYTHKPTTIANMELIKYANKNGFVINLSANNLTHADELSDLGIGPVTVVLPYYQMENTKTPNGRVVVVCPAITKKNITCAKCKLCASNKENRPIVGFPAHGKSKKKVTIIAEK